MLKYPDYISMRSPSRVRNNISRRFAATVTTYFTVSFRLTKLQPSTSSAQFTATVTFFPFNRL